MKHYRILITFLFALPCAVAAENISLLYQKLETSLSPEVMACKAQQRNMDSSYKLVTDPISNGQRIEFLKEEQKVLQILRMFRVQDIVGPKHQTQFRKLIFSNCSDVNLERYAQLEKARERCDSSFSQLNFMQGLAAALLQNEWSVTTQAFAKIKMIAYLKHMSDLKTFLSHRIIALSILDEMQKSGIIPRSFAAIIKGTKSKAELYMLNLSDEQKIRTQFSANCPKFKEVVLKELSFSDKINEEILAILNQL